MGWFNPLLFFLIPFVLFSVFVGSLMMTHKRMVKECFGEGRYEEGFRAAAKAVNIKEVEEGPAREMDEVIKDLGREDALSLSRRKARAVAGYMYYLAHKKPERAEDPCYNRLLSSFMERFKREGDIRRMHIILNATLSPGYRKIFQEEIKDFLFKGG